MKTIPGTPPLWQSSKRYEKLADVIAYQENWKRSGDIIGIRLRSAGNEIVYLTWKDAKRLAKWIEKTAPC